eukprot:g15916.t1
MDRYRDRQKTMPGTPKVRINVVREAEGSSNSFRYPSSPGSFRTPSRREFGPLGGPHAGFWQPPHYVSLVEISSETADPLPRSNASLD